jgi:DNA polymerase V
MKTEQIYKSVTLSNNKAERPLFLSTVKAGFPSPADDFMEQTLNINDYVVKKPSSTYYVRVSGDSMIGAGIFSGDVLVVDRSMSITDNCIVVAMIENEFMVKRFCNHKGHYYLLSENSMYDPLEVTDKDVSIWGVVTFTIHKVN